MPILKNAIKKLRTDAKRTERNKLVRTKTKSVLKTVRASLKVEDLSAAFSALDRAAKKGVFHKSKADRLKSRLTKLVAKGEVVKVVKKAKKTTKKLSKKIKAGKKK